MATYVYNCRTCGVFKEIVRPMIEQEVIPTCDTCSEDMKRVYSPAPVKFNGTGFYSTDNYNG